MKQIIILFLIILTSISAVNAYTWTNATVNMGCESLSVSNTGVITGCNTGTGEVYISNNYGLTWNNPITISWPVFVSVSDNGQIIFTVEGITDKKIFYSTDSGVSWINKTTPFGEDIWASDISGDGSTFIVITADSSDVWISKDYGDTWTDTSINLTDIFYVSTSYDGSKILLGTYGGYLYWSGDSGTTFGSIPDIGTGNWYGVDMSSSGTRMIACDDTGTVYYTFNEGADWYSSTEPFIDFRDCAISDNNIMIVADYTRGTFYSIDNGTTWTVIDNSTYGWYEVGISDNGRIIAANDGVIDTIIIGTDTCSFCTEACSPCGGGCTATDLSFMYDSYNFTSDPSGVGDITGWDTSCITNMRGIFEYSNFNQPIGSWDVSSVQNFGTMFYTTHFNQDISGWNMSSAWNIESMFEEDPLFNQNISGWDVSNVAAMGYVFYNDVAFNQDLGSWNFVNVTNMEGFLGGVTLSVNNYDALLIAIQYSFDHQDVALDGGLSQYSQASAFERSVLVDNGWTITDGGMVPATIFSFNDNIILGYHFNNLSDVTGNHPLTDYSSGVIVLSTDKDGDADSAYQYSDSGYLATPYTSAMDTSQPFTISAWIKYDLGSATNSGFFSKTDLNNHYGDFSMMDPPATKQYYSEQTYFKTSISNTQWHHFAMVFDGSTLYWYREGALTGTTTSVTPVNNPWQLVFGCWYDANLCIVGKVDEFVWTNNALNDSQITELYTAYDNWQYVGPACTPNWQISYSPSNCPSNSLWTKLYTDLNTCGQAAPGDNGTQVSCTYTPPTYDNQTFEGKTTTDLNTVENITAVTNFTVATTGSAVQWTETLDLTNITNVADIIVTTPTFISVDTTTAPELQAPAEVALTIPNTIQNLCQDFLLYYSPGFYSTQADVIANGYIVATGANVGGDCIDPGICTNVQCTNGVITFTAAGFSGFGITTLIVDTPTNTGLLNTRNLVYAGLGLLAVLILVMIGWGIVKVFEGGTMDFMTLALLAISGAIMIIIGYIIIYFVFKGLGGT